MVILSLVSLVWMETKNRDYRSRLGEGLHSRFFVRKVPRPSELQENLSTGMESQQGAVQATAKNGSSVALSLSIQKARYSPIPGYFSSVVMPTLCVFDA